MAKLYFRYSSMNAGKSLDLLKVAYNYEERGQQVLLLTSNLDDRYGIGKIKSRVGLEKEAVIINKDTNIIDIRQVYKLSISVLSNLINCLN